MVVTEAALPTETIKSTAKASGQNKDPLFSHNPATFELSRNQEDKGRKQRNATGCKAWRENKPRIS